MHVIANQCMGALQRVSLCGERSPKGALLPPGLQTAGSMADFEARGVAIRSPRRETWQGGGSLGEFVTPYEFAQSTAVFCALPRGYGLPRRFAPRNHHVFSHHDKRKCDILEAWQKFAVISAIWKINYYLNKLQNLGWQPPNICYGLSIILPKKTRPGSGLVSCTLFWRIPTLFS